MTGKVKKLVLLNLPYLIFVYLFDKLCQGVRLAPGADASEKLLHIGQGFSAAFASLAPSFHLVDLCVGAAGAVLNPAGGLLQGQEREEIPPGYRVRERPLECIILSVKELYMDAQEVMHMTDYSKITALYSRLSVGDEDRDGGESNSIQNHDVIYKGWITPPKITS